MMPAPGKIQWEILHDDNRMENIPEFRRGKIYVMPLMILLMMMFTRFFHPFFVSVVEVEYVTKDREVGISCKIFSDDLEKAIKGFSKQDIDILKGDKKKNNELLEKYFATHLSISLDGKMYIPTYLGYENDKEATWIYLEVKNVPPPAKLDVLTDILYDYNKSQQNIIHCILDGKRQSYRLQFPEKKAAFSLN